MSTEQQKAFAKETLLKCKGFSPKFINGKTNLNIDKILPKDWLVFLPTVEGNKKGILNYTDLSVAYHKERKVPIFSAYNVDGSLKSEKVKRANSFKPDPRIDSLSQLSKDFYDLRTDITEFEIGHMAANNELAWGNDAQTKSYQTFHFTNSVPQAENLNTGIWKSLETYIISEASQLSDNKKISVITGPILQNNDPAYNLDTSFKIPLLFYKLIIFDTQDGLYSTAFIMSHEEKLKEQKMFATTDKKGKIDALEILPFSDFKYKKVFQVNINLLEEMTGLNFTWKGIKKISVPNDKNQIKKIRKIKDSSDIDGKKRISNLSNQNTFSLNIILPK